MYFPRKLKQDFSITGLIPAIICVSIYALISIFFGVKEAILFASVFFIFYSGFLFWFYFITRNLRYLAASRKGREVFELAFISTEPQPDGFTEHPHPAGKAEYSRDDLYGFSGFLGKDLVAMPYFKETRIVLVPVKMDDEFIFILNPGKFRQYRSWIAFDLQENVTLNISKRDYIKNKEELSLDQLCKSMGKLFIEFMCYDRKGEQTELCIS